MLNNKDLFKIIGNIDDDLILRSGNTANNEAKSKKWFNVFAAAISIGLCVVILAAAIIFYGGGNKTTGDDSVIETPSYGRPPLSDQSWMDDEIHYENAIEPVT